MKERLPYPEALRELELYLESLKIHGHDTISAPDGDIGKILEEKLGKSEHMARKSLKAGKEKLEDIRKEVSACRKCSLAETRTNTVFGVGDAKARLMFIGEGPGADEDLQGEPFVGRAGKLLTKMIEGMGLSREEVYIANIVKCRPPGNRDPKPEESSMCIGYLERQIAAIRPQVICALGKVAAQTLLRSDKPIGALRGRFHEYGSSVLLPTYHPSYLLRNPSAKKDAWEDLKMILGRMGLTVPGT